MRSRLVALGLVLGLSCCTLSSLGPQTRFSDAAYVLNDAARWGQLDVAAGHVDDSYLPQFRARREGWGEAKQIAEVELLQLTLSPDKASATSEVSFSWTDAAGVALRRSFVTQRWKSRRGDYRLVSEEIKRGDPSLFTN